MSKKKKKKKEMRNLKRNPWWAMPWKKRIGPISDDRAKSTLVGHSRAAIDF